MSWQPPRLGLRSMFLLHSRCRQRNHSRFYIFQRRMPSTCRLGPCILRYMEERYTHHSTCLRQANLCRPCSRYMLSTPSRLWLPRTFQVRSRCTARCRCRFYTCRQRMESTHRRRGRWNLRCTSKQWRLSSGWVSLNYRDTRGKLTQASRLLLPSTFQPSNRCRLHCRW